MVFVPLPDDLDLEAWRASGGKATDE